MQDYHKLVVWQRASELTKLVFTSTTEFPRFFDGNLAAQLRRSVVSIALNISEGCGRKGGADFLRFLQNAMGSATEVECSLELSRNLGYLDAPSSSKLLGHVVEVKRMLTGLMKSLGWKSGAKN
ncbi:MAG TPA: four helix bundle protein [Planctomycetota bacterium]|nr:four helix bundle protein [Planctomycetota bacterium]